MKRVFASLYRVAAHAFRGTGISQVYPLNRINAAVMACLRRDRAEVDGHVFVLDAHDSLGLSSVGFFEPVVTALVKDLVQPGSVVVDVGANIGYFTLLFARAAGPDGHVYAFEPHPGNFRLLETNVRANGYGNVTAVQAAVAEAPGETTLYLAENDHVDHRIYEAERARPGQPVQLVSLDTFFASRESKVDFVKVDVQGAELRVLMGMRQLIAQNPGLRMVTEFWPYGLEAAGSPPEAYLEALRAAGFVLHELDDRRKSPRAVDDADLLARLTPRNRKHTNLYCEPAAPIVHD